MARFCATPCTADKNVGLDAKPKCRAFFCVCSNVDKDGYVYALFADKKTPAKKIENESPLDIVKATKYVPRVVTPRLFAQEGLFVVFPKPNEELQEQLREEWQLKRFFIAANLKVEMRYILSRFGIHRSSLFPGTIKCVRCASKRV